VAGKGLREGVAWGGGGTGGGLWSCVFDGPYVLLLIYVNTTGMMYLKLVGSSLPKFRGQT
jgi:hypothetical protein